MRGSGGFASRARAFPFDPDSILVREPGVLLAPHFLGALHEELSQQLGAEDAALALAQIGFLHGLRDALRVVSERMQAPEATPDLAAAPLALRFRSEPQVRGFVIRAVLQRLRELGVPPVEPAANGTPASTVALPAPANGVHAAATSGHAAVPAPAGMHNSWPT